MILRFANHEDAAMAAAKLRDEGHFAELCDDSSAALWGPGAVGGVRVITTGAPVEDMNELPSPSRPAGVIWNVMRLIVAAAGLVAAAALTWWMLMLAVKNPVLFLLLAAFVIVMTYAGAAWSMICQKLLSASILRRRSKSVLDPVFLLVLALVVLVALAVT